MLSFMLPDLCLADDSSLLMNLKRFRATIKFATCQLISAPL